jgi:hypothetical protein
MVLLLLVMMTVLLQVPQFCCVARHAVTRAAVYPGSQRKGRLAAAAAERGRQHT